MASGDVVEHQWLRVYVRLFLGSEMIGYGMVKVWPVQFGRTSLSTLLVPFGEMCLCTNNNGHG